jgi:hypothetical protein
MPFHEYEQAPIETIAEKPSVMGRLVEFGASARHIGREMVRRHYIKKLDNLFGHLLDVFGYDTPACAAKHSVMISGWVPDRYLSFEAAEESQAFTLDLRRNPISDSISSFTGTFSSFGDSGPGPSIHYDFLDPHCELALVRQAVGCLEQALRNAATDSGTLAN